LTNISPSRYRLLVGCGALGIRHLQGLLASEAEGSQIVVVEPCSDARSFARLSSYISIDDYNKIIFLDSLESLPSGKISICIVSTSSKPRLSILKHLCALNIDILVIEKLLFPSIDELAKSCTLRMPAQTYVNCPKPLYGYYQDLRDKISLRKGFISFSAAFVSDLASNAIHWLDLFYFLSGTRPSMSDVLTTSIRDVYPSKRLGYSDFTGDISLLTDNFSANICSSSCGSQSREVLSILSAADHIIVDETRCLMHTLDAPNGIVSCNFDIPLQSSLTSRYSNGSDHCVHQLTPYSDSLTLHKLYLSSIAQALTVGNAKSKKDAGRPGYIFS
jgi:hypothetical protein